tara:strand:- start:44 stop:232 length:189 start_codon:yes stop_codon:yes gene_type:complete
VYYLENCNNKRKEKKMQISKQKPWNRPYSKRLYDLIQGNVDKVNHDNEVYNKKTKGKKDADK